MVKSIDGFINCNITTRKIQSRTTGSALGFGTNADKNMEWALMSDYGLIPHPELSCYIRDNYGAWMGNVGDNISTIEELLGYVDSDLGVKIYSRFQKYIDKGYELVIGPGAPVSKGIVYGHAVYCKNWQEVVNAEMEKNQGLSKKSIN